MKSVALILFLIPLLHAQVANNNSFDAIRGCRQNYNLPGYDGQIDYVSANSLPNVVKSGGSTVFKIGIVGTNDGIFRYGESRFPYGRDVIEIVISGWANTQSAGRRQHRKTNNQQSYVQLAAVPTQGLLSPFYPTIILLEVYSTGLVRITKAGDKVPFLVFIDERRIPANYIGFTKHENNDVIYFYDCPL